MVDAVGRRPRELLQQIRPLITETGTALAELRDRVVEEQHFLTKFGFRGIGRNLQRLVSALDAVLASPAAAVASVEAGVAGAAAAIVETNPQQSITALTRVTEDIAEAADSLTTLDTVLGNLHTLIGEVLHGGSPGDWQRRAGHCRHLVDQARRALAKVKASVDAGTSDALRAGQDDVGHVAGTSSAAIPLIGEQAAVPDAETGRRFTGSLSGPVRKAAALLPRAQPGSKTYGYLLDVQGRQLGGGPIVSGRAGPGKGQPGLAPQYRRGPDSPPVADVEGHVAAMMRTDRSLRRMTLVLNRYPCDRTKWARGGCEELLESWLPEGATVDVYVRGNGDTMWHRRFTGNGEGVIEQ